MVSFIYTAVDEGKEGLMRMKWVIAGRTVKPSANTGVNDKEKRVPDCKAGGIFSRNHCCFLSFTKDLVF